MENKEEVTIDACVSTFLPERGKGKVVEGKADVNKISPREDEEVVEVIVNDFNNMNVLSEEQRKLMTDNFNKRMTMAALHIKDELKRQSDNRNKKIIDEGLSK